MLVIPPQNGPRTLSQNAVPVGIPASGTIGANGTLTLGTAFGVIYNGGIWLYFPAGAVFAGSPAGLYWTVMSSTTAGTVYNTRATGPAPIPANPTAVVDAGPGAYTQDINAEVTVHQATIPGGLMGLNGSWRLWFLTNMANTAGLKTHRFKANGTLSLLTAPVNNGSINSVVQVRNRGRQDMQVAQNGIQSPLGTSAGFGQQQSINTAADMVITETMQLAVATDWMVCEWAHVEVLPS